MKLELTFLAVSALLTTACGRDAAAPPPTPRCSSVACALAARGKISRREQEVADSIIDAALAFPDTDGEIHAAVATLARFDSAGLFPDSVRFDRMIDRVAVTAEVSQGNVPRDALGRYYPRRTPRLAWSRIVGRGINFQPVNSAQHVIYPVPKPWSAPTDSIRLVAEALWRYSVPTRLASGEIVPIWEYEFPHVSGGVAVTAPWRSGMAQGYALMLFAELYRRTQDPVWRTRAYAVIPSMLTSWDSGGVRLPDTSAGYWFEEYHPTVRVFNGAAHAALHWGVAAKAFPDDPAVQRTAQSAAQAILQRAPLYDDGRWTLYSMTQGWNTQSYHDMHVALMRELFAQTGDSAFVRWADKWAAYVRPY